MGQEIPPNYGKLVFCFPLTTEVDFDPTLEALHGLLSESSHHHQREESEQTDQPMQIHMNSHPGAQDALSRERNLPVNGNNNFPHQEGSSEPPEEEPPQDDQPEKEATPSHEQVDHTQDDPMGEEVADIWKAKDVPDEDYAVEQVTRSSISASNPWVLYEAGMICARDEDGQIKPNHSGEKVITLREWAHFLSPQRVALRRQSIGRDKLPWTGHLCYLVTRSWEMGRLRSYYLKTRQLSHLRNFLEDCRYNHTDWLRGQGRPPGWEDRFDIEREQWSENWLLYERDLMIQADLEWFAEAVYQFYKEHLDKLIGENDRMWGEFCKKRYDDDRNETGLELQMSRFP